jgi:uncharacterized membrane protein
MQAAFSFTRFIACTSRIKGGVMESRAKLFGHAVHPILIVFPLGLLATAIIFDIITLATGHGFWSQIAYWMIAAGIIGGLAAALFGFIDYLAIPANTRARSVGFWHGVGNVVVVMLFLASWLMRRPDPLNPGVAAYTLSFAGAGLALLTGWLGGELVERLGVGVDDGANLDAPNSLSGRPASESASRR